MEGLKKKKKEEKNLVKNPPNFSLPPTAHCVKNPIFVQKFNLHFFQELNLKIFCQCNLTLVLQINSFYVILLVWHSLPPLKNTPQFRSNCWILEILKFQSWPTWCNHSPWNASIPTKRKRVCSLVCSCVAAETMEKDISRYKCHQRDRLSDTAFDHKIV